MSGWAVLTLGVASGLDLYLTLLVLGVSARLGWADVLGPSVGALATAPALGMALALYLVETTADRFPAVTLGWDAVHLLVRPMAIGLVVVLLARDAGSGQAALLGLAAASVALVTHAIRTGWRLVLTLTEVRRSARTLASAVEDVCALALVALLLDRPSVAGILGVTLLVLLLTQAPRHLAAFRFGMHLLRARVAGVFSHRGWKSVDTDTPGKGGGGSATRGERAALLGPGGPTSLVTGWLLLAPGEGARFRVSRSDGGTPVGDWSGALVRSGPLYDTLLREDREGLRALFLPKDGPPPEAVRAALGGDGRVG